MPVKRRLAQVKHTYNRSVAALYQEYSYAALPVPECISILVLPYFLPNLPDKEHGNTFTPQYL